MERLNTYIVDNLPGFATYLLLIVQQSFIAVSAWLLARALEQFQAGAEYRMLLSWYLAAMVLPYLPGCLSFVTLQWWVNHAHRRLVRRMLALLEGQTTRFSDCAARSLFETALSRHAFSATNQYLSLSHDFLALGLNSLLSAGVLGWLLPFELVWGYSLSVLGSAGLVVWLSPKINRKAIVSQQAMGEYGQVLGAAWANLTLGNRWNVQQWWRASEHAGRRWYSSSLCLAAQQQAANAVIALVALLPTVYLIYQVAMRPSTSTASMAAVIVSLTRIFHILGSLSTLVYQYLAWQAARAQLGCLRNALRPSAHEYRLVPGGLSLNGAPIECLESAQSSILSAPKGRFTVRGPNGAGKSTLLVHLKQRLGREGWYVPADPQQLQWACTGVQRSTGQHMLAVLDEIEAACEQPRVLLLDEWDANLDPQHRQRVDRWLQRQSELRVVVEVRHLPTGRRSNCH